MATHSDSLATTTLNSSDAHPKRRRQLRSSIASAPSTPAAPEIFDATHVTSYSVKLRGTVSGTSPYFSKAAHAGFSTSGGAHVRMLLPEDLYNRLPGFSALVTREETPSPLPFGCPMDGLPNLTRQHSVMVDPCYGIFLPLPATGGPDLTGSPFRLSAPHQA